MRAPPSGHTLLASLQVRGRSSPMNFLGGAENWEKATHYVDRTQESQ